MLVHRVDAVDGDASLAPLAAADGDARITRLGRIEGAPFLDLDTRLQASQLEVVPPVERQLGYLARIDDAAHRCLRRVDRGDALARDFDLDDVPSHRQLRLDARG